MNYLGIDFGGKHVGIAISSGTSASGLCSVFRGEAISRIVLLCRQHKIDRCVVGLPEGHMKKAVEEFATKLRAVVFCQVVLWDETLTTASAKNQLGQTEFSSKNRKNKEHKTAAAILLQSYLDSSGER